jgi:hypothetical protein
METQLHHAGEVQDAQEMDQPTFRLHSLKGNRRVTFLFEDGDAYDVDLEDYHQEETGDADEESRSPWSARQGQP